MGNMPNLGGKVTPMGKLIRELLLAGMSNKDIVSKVLEQFPEQQLQAKSLKQYVANLRYLAKRKAVGSESTAVEDQPGHEGGDWDLGSDAITNP